MEQAKAQSPMRCCPSFCECGRTISILDVLPLLKKRWCERTSEGKLLRKAFVAREVALHGGVAICVTVSARSLVGPEKFVEVFVDVPPDVAAARRARRKRKPSRAKRAKQALRRTMSRLPCGRPRSAAFARPCLHEILPSCNCGQVGK